MADTTNSSPVLNDNESEEQIAIQYLQSLDNLMKDCSELNESATCDNNIETFDVETNNVKVKKIYDYQKLKAGLNLRMETILEEPSLPKLTVREILARFETLNDGDMV